ncbi:hypothetical protein J8N05_45525 [Streptomyces sp. BH-SS-21]|uniref:Lipoprotein n=1 Tax=Streptomyces liliiviolaceus TaxID=2823109 RepID=A0A941BEN6_9ACTN|nr:hypothetical protein [Streptomyces liliiviolaceus]MBQ0855433.1 hypothetical protein [Streptomyces liliiviolaceus]
MRVRIAAILGTTALALALPACSPGATTQPATTAPVASPRHQGDGSTNPPLSSTALRARLLTRHDLGDGYVLKPQSPTRHSEVTVLGCPALDELGDDTAMFGSLGFPRQAKASFVYDDGSDGELSEELYSDTSKKLSTGAGKIFGAMTGCSAYQVLVDGTAIDVSTQELAAPRLGTERWSQLLTFTTGGRTTTVKQTAIRTDTVLMVLSGSPTLVEFHLDKALAKVTEPR